MRRPPASGAFAAAALAILFSSCQQVFTWSVASALARPSTVQDGLTLSQATDIAAAALENGDAQMAEAVLPQLLDLASGLTGAARDQAVSQAVDLALLSSNLSVATTDALAVYAQVPDGATPTDAQLQQLRDAFSSISVSPSDLEAFRALSSVDPSAVAPADYAFAGAALVLSTFDGAFPADMSPAQVAAVQADPAYQQGLDLIDTSITLIQASGGDPSAVGILSVFTSLPGAP